MIEPIEIKENECHWECECDKCRQPERSSTELPGSATNAAENVLSSLMAMFETEKLIVMVASHALVRDKDSIAQKLMDCLVEEQPNSVNQRKLSIILNIMWWKEEIRWAALRGGTRNKKPSRIEVWPIKKQKRWRYYCDFCKKSGGQKTAMLKHEKSCTKNHDRQCYMCEIVDGCTETKELVELVKTFPVDEYGNIEGVDYVEKLREKADSCPACMLAAVRLSCVSLVEFNYEKEVEEMWKEHNSNNAQYW